MKKVILLFIITSLASCGSVAKYNTQITKTHSKAALQEDIDYAYHILKRNHPDLDEYMPQKELDYKFDSLKKAIQPMNTHDFYYALNSVMKNIGQGHTTIGMPFKKYTHKERKARGKRKGFTNKYIFRAIDNRLFIARNTNKDSTLQKGTEILSINGEEITPLLKKYQKQVTSDGYNTTFHPKYVGRRFWRFYQNDKGILDSIKLQCKLKDSLFDYKLIATYTKKGEKKKDKKEVSKKDTIAKAKDTLNKLAKKALRKKHKIYAYDSKTKSYYRDFKFIDGLDKPVAYLKIRGFRAGKYKKAYDSIFKKIDSSKTQHLIIDLRNNFGGSLNEIAYLYSYLASNKFQMVEKAKMTKRTSLFNMGLINTTVVQKTIALLASPVLTYITLAKTSKDKDGNIYFKYKNSKTQEPQQNSFKGKVYVLINGNSFSASSVLSTQLKATKRAIFVGEETGGTYNTTVAGGFLHPELPNSKITMRFGLMSIKTPYHQTPEGHGVYPDKEITTSIADFLAGKDSELAWVLEKIRD